MFYAYTSTYLDTYKLNKYSNMYPSFIKSENKSMMSLKYYFSYNSFIRRNIAEIFFNDYDDTNLFDNNRLK